MSFLGTLFGEQKTATTTTSSKPWKPQAPYIKKVFKRAEDLYTGEQPKYFPNSTVAGFSPEQQQAQKLGAKRALGGNPLMNMAEKTGMGIIGGGQLNANNPQARKYYNDVLGGKYLNTFDKNGALFNSIQSQVNPAVNAQFMMSGRTGSGAHQGRMAEAMTNAYAPIAQQQYLAERGIQSNAANTLNQNYQNAAQRQLGMIGMAPEFANQDWRDLAALDAIGTQKQNLGQQEINDQKQRWDFYQNQPLNSLKNYAALISGDYGGVSSQQQPYQSPGLFQQALGFGLGAAGTAGDLGWKPFG